LSEHAGIGTVGDVGRVEDVEVGLKELIQEPRRSRWLLLSDSARNRKAAVTPREEMTIQYPYSVLLLGGLQRRFFRLLGLSFPLLELVALVLFLVVSLCDLIRKDLQGVESRVIRPYMVILRFDEEIPLVDQGDTESSVSAGLALHSPSKPSQPT